MSGVELIAGYLVRAEREQSKGREIQEMAIYGTEQGIAPEAVTVYEMTLKQ